MILFHNNAQSHKNRKNNTKFIPVEDNFDILMQKDTKVNFDIKTINNNAINKILYQIGNELLYKHITTLIYDIFSISIRY